MFLLTAVAVPTVRMVLRACFACTQDDTLIVIFDTYRSHITLEFLI
jgi:hypothetical protein